MIHSALYRKKLAMGKDVPGIEREPSGGGNYG